MFILYNQQAFEKNKKFKQCYIYTNFFLKTKSLLSITASVPIFSAGKQLWQLGKTQVFMRDSVYEALIWWQKDIVSLTLQRWWRGCIFLYKFRKYRKAVREKKC